VVQYTRNSLIASQAEVATTFHAHEYPHFENFSLGNDASGTEEKYWERVAVRFRGQLGRVISRGRSRRCWCMGRVSRDPVFREVVERAVEGNFI